MYVEIGNDKAIEGYREDGEDAVQYRTLEGERTTRIEFPPNTGLQEAYSIVVDGVLPNHMDADAKPVWIESDSEGLKALLDDKYGTADKNKRTGWGE